MLISVFWEGQVCRALHARSPREPKPAPFFCVALARGWLSWLRALLLLDVIKGWRRGHASGLLLCDFLGLGHGASSACGRLRAGIVLEPGELLGGSLRGSHRHSLRGFQRHLARRSPGPWSGFAFRRCLQGNVETTSRPTLTPGPVQREIGFKQWLQHGPTRNSDSKACDLMELWVDMRRVLGMLLTLLSPQGNAPLEA